MNQRVYMYVADGSIQKCSFLSRKEVAHLFQHLHMKRLYYGRSRGIGTPIVQPIQESSFCHCMGRHVDTG